MTEIYRFFDNADITEAAQAEIQRRFRATGVLREVTGLLALSAPGGLFVRLAPGEAMVEGFHYINTANLDKAVASNTSGSTRIDLVILRVNRTANTLLSDVLQGTPGAGAPALTQVDGGTYEYPLWQLTIPTGSLAITAGMITDLRTYSKMLHTADEIVLATPVVPTPQMTRRVLSVDAASNGLYLDTEPPPGRNYLHNSSFRVNQRGITFTSTNGGYPSDRWVAGILNPGGYIGYVGNDYAASGQMPSTGPDARLSTYLQRGDSGGSTPAGALITLAQVIEGTDVRNMIGRTLVLSFWAYSTKTGTFGCSVEAYSGGPYGYHATFTINQANTWEYKYVVIPWGSGITWSTAASASMLVRFVAAAGTTYTATVANQWNTQGKYAAAGITNPLTTINDTLWILAPKLEIGSFPTKYETPDQTTEIMQCYRYLYIATNLMQGFVHGPTTIVAVEVMPVPMRGIPGFSVNVTPTWQNGSGPGTNQIAGLFNGAFITGFTYLSWAAWLTSNHQYGTIISSSTSGSGTAGAAGSVLLGTGVQAIFSAEL